MTRGRNYQIANFLGKIAGRSDNSVKGFEVHTAADMNGAAIFRDIPPYSPFVLSHTLIFGHEDGGDTFLRNVRSTYGLHGWRYIPQNGTSHSSKENRFHLRGFGNHRAQESVLCRVTAMRT
jgi:hypothetical protein